MLYVVIHYYNYSIQQSTSYFSFQSFIYLSVLYLKDHHYSVTFLFFEYAAIQGEILTATRKLCNTSESCNENLSKYISERE